MKKTVYLVFILAAAMAAFAFTVWLLLEAMPGEWNWPQWWVAWLLGVFMLKGLIQVAKDAIAKY